MSENENHETGGTFVNEDVITEQCGNTKMVIIQSAEPSNMYDGQFWIDTDDDPPYIRVRDQTNTAWMTKYEQSYETGGFDAATGTSPAANGTIVVKYDGTSSYIFIRTNSLWGIVGTT